MVRKFVGAIFGVTSTPNSPQQYAGSRNLYQKLWWVLDPSHTHHCEDCQRLAAGSPYDPPWTDKNVLQRTPGDGGTHCGADCTCTLSYTPPPPATLGSVEPTTNFQLLLRTYSHGQIRYLAQEGCVEKILAQPDLRQWPRDVPDLQEPEAHYNPPHILYEPRHKRVLAPGESFTCVCTQGQLVISPAMVTLKPVHGPRNSNHWSVRLSSLANVRMLGNGPWRLLLFNALDGRQFRADYVSVADAQQIITLFSRIGQISDR